ncbi:nucleotidyltransferase family protein [Rhabdothermincola salaria]|uniref:nucleotidyltransferase family protein n=1 Tax=Rhabdothermincola salaria TaxID=2903142 RepID=UPI001E3C9631|nr:nucleotidyltransferase family protein [Rhabdothermincola salaria]MCD9623243.1 nucleotidyltransferase family protein [Rhabdothermincola salaria]
MNADEIVAGIDPHHRQMLVAALCPEPEASDAWRAWRAAVDFDDIDDATQRLLPLVARRRGVIPDDDPVRRRVRGLYRQAWVRNHRLWHQALPPMAAFEARAIPTLLMKGGALLPVYGGDWGARPMYDIDVLVPDERFDEAADELTSLGWTPEQGEPVEWVGQRMRPFLNGWGFQSGEHGHLDLHHHALAGSMWTHADRAFWEGSVVIDVAGTRQRVLQPADLLVHLLLHGVQFDNNPPVQWIADVVHVARSTPVGVLAPRFLAQARTHGALRVAEAGLGAVLDLTGEPTVEPILQAVRGQSSYLERLRHHRGPAARPLLDLSRNATGGAGPIRGARDLVHRRLELHLVAHPTAALARAASGRSATVGRALRRISGPIARVPRPPDHDLVLPTDLDLTQPSTLNRFGGPGWWKSTPEGAVTMGRESYLVLSLPRAAHGRALTVQLDAASLDGPKAVEVLADDTVVARAVVGDQPQTVFATVVPPLAGHAPTLDLVVRVARPGLRPRPAVNLRVLGAGIALAPSSPDR